ncbi:MAG: T9SS type A sorting domain-containing protein [Bacteroidota bacterium]
MKTIKFLGILAFIIVYLSVSAQIKVYSGGNVCVGSTSTTPNKPLVVAKSGGIRILQTAFADSTNELTFGDNGQIRSKDNNHRIIFDRSNNILELREYGDLYFSPGATSGARTQKVTFTSAGNINLNGASNSYQINGAKMVWHNGQTSDMFVGFNAGNATMSGHNNTYLGSHAGFVTTSGDANTALGYATLRNTTTGYSNTALGWAALYTNTSGAYNTAIGNSALNSGTTGNYNTALGNSAGFSITTGSNSTFVGYGANANAGTYSNCAAIGNGTVVTASNKMFFGNSSITHIQGQVLFTTYSDGRFKTDIIENVKGLEFINKLRPVTYKMDTKALDDFIIQNMPDSIKAKHREGMDFTPSKAIIHSGFIAQEVELAAQQVGFVSSIVSVPSNANDPYALSYAEIVVPLVKAVQELSKTADSLETKTQNLDSTNTAKDEALQAMQNQINQLESLINSCCNIDKSMQRNNSGPESITNSNEVQLNNKNIVLYQNKPNPFNNQTVIEYYIPENSFQSFILIFDMQGKLLKTVSLEQKENGSIKIDASSLLPGMYMYSLVVDNKEMDTKRMILTE